MKQLVCLCIFVCLREDAVQAKQMVRTISKRPIYIEFAKKKTFNKKSDQQTGSICVKQLQVNLLQIKMYVYIIAADSEDVLKYEAKVVANKEKHSKKKPEKKFRIIIRNLSFKVDNWILDL